MGIEVKWIKIKTDIFDDEKIILIEGLPDSYEIITIWFKLLCLAGKQNNDGVFVMNNKIPYTDKMLATIFRMKETTVTMALQTFENFEMIEIVNGIITIPNWNKHQSLDKFEQAKEKNRNRVAAYREKQKAIAKCNDYSNVTDHYSVMPCNDAEKDKDKDIFTTTTSHARTREEKAMESDSSFESGNQMATKWQPNGNQMATQYRLGKNSITTTTNTRAHAREEENGNLTVDVEKYVENYVEKVENANFSEKPMSKSVESNGIPTLDEVRAYFAEKQIDGSPEKFYDYNKRKNADFKRWKDYADTWGVLERREAQSGGFQAKKAKQKEVGFDVDEFFDANLQRGLDIANEVLKKKKEQEETQ